MAIELPSLNDPVCHQQSSTEERTDNIGILATHV
jgi:hypothetical protein